jgi:energy-coupling factor transport system ATP-binding protein
VSERVIWVTGLHHTYMAGTPLAQESLRGIDLEVRREEIVAVIGATGSGKSTLLQHLNGLWRPQAGHVRVVGRDLGDSDTDLRQVRRTVGLVFQRPEQQLFEHFVGDDVAYGPRLVGLGRDELRERVRWAMELVGLDFEGYKDRPVITLSGGERRKVGLAGVLALRPEVLLLDEPTAGLDPAARRDLLQRLSRLRAEGMTLVVATHNMDDVAALADRVYVLDRGCVALQGTTRQVYAQAERLRALGLDVPWVTSLMTALYDRGLPVPLDVLTSEEAEDVLVEVLS